MNAVLSRSHLHRRGLTAATIAALALMTAAGCGSDSDSGSGAGSSGSGESGTLAKIKDEGKVTIGTSGVYPPFEFAGEGGKLQGYDIDLCTDVAKKLGVEPEFQKVAFEGILASLKSKRVDMLCSALTKTPDREKEVAFSNAYFKTRMAITVPKGTTDIKSRDDLKGKVVGAEQGSRGAFEAQSIAGVKDVKIYPSVDLALKDAENGRVDAVTEMLPATSYLIERNYPELEVATDYVYPEGGEVGINTRIGDDDLLDAINDALAELESEGVIDQLDKKWLEAN